MKRNRFLYGVATLALSGGLLFTSCSDDDKEVPTPKPTEPERITTDEQFYANHFAHDILEIYYYWNEQIASDLKKLNPLTNVDPVKTVDEIKYHQNGKEIDKWTSLIADMKEFQEGVSGVSTTYGYQLLVYRLSNTNQYVGTVAFVYKDSPAQKAGLKRGDIIFAIDGEKITEKNYEDLFYSANATFSMAELKMEGDKGIITPTGKDVSLTAVKMYEDPVLVDSIYECNGKKVGYLAYASFDLRSIPKLIDISKKFKAEGVKELILDFRYNGGGYVITENAMASMYAPQDAVDARELFEIEKFNKILTEELKKEGEDGKTTFRTKFEFKDEYGLPQSYSTKDANIGLEKIYGLITKNSASASEALLSGLMPYVDVELIGTPSHGKYCTGWMIAAENAYEKVPRPIKNWGIYVMVSIYQNAKGETPCMPDGLQPLTEVLDDPMIQTQLGDVNEKMLKVALQRAGKVYDEKESQSRAGWINHFQQVEGTHKANFGKRILLPNQLPFLNK